MSKFLFLLVPFFVAGIALAQPATVSYAYEYSYPENEVMSTYSFPENDVMSTDSISTNDISFISSIYSDFDSSFHDLNSTILDFNDSISLLSDYTGYNGSIPEPYYSYLKDCLSWSLPGDNYVAFPSSYYYNNRNYVFYVIAISDSLVFNGSFSGSDVDVYEFFPSPSSHNGNISFRHSIQSTFSFSPNGQLCFTDLSSSYPDLRGLSNRYLFVMLCIIALVIVFYTLTKFGWGNVHIRRRSGRRKFL